MKPLDKNKKYDLSQLNHEQLQTILDWLKKNDKGWRSISVTDLKTVKTIFFDGYEWKSFEEDSVNAIELFKEDNEKLHQIAYDLVEKGKQQGLKIVVTFESI